MDYLNPYLSYNKIPLAKMLDATTEPENLEEKDNSTPSIFKAVEAMCKGIEIPLPDGHSSIDKYGFERRMCAVFDAKKKTQKPYLTQYSKWFT
jgi:hypothetical protein